MDYDIIIVGAGSGGLVVASGAAQLGAKVALVSREKLGGDCLYYGCVPSKAIIHSAKVAQTIREGEKYGMNKMEPQFEFQNVIKRVQNVISLAEEHDDPERFRKMGIDVIFGEGSFKDAYTVNVKLTDNLKDIQQENIVAQGNEFSISAKKIVIATGSRTFIPPIEGLEETGFITNVEVFSLEKQPKSLAVIGGGPIGCELSQTFQRLGTEVHILVRGASVMSKDDPDVAEFIMKKFKEEGIDIIPEMNIVKVEKTEGGKKITYTQGDNTNELEVEEILVSTGRTPNIEMLNLEAAGIKYGKRGIPTNNKLRTNKRHIYAVGDVNGQYLFTHTAGYEAGAVVSNAIMHFPRKVDYKKIPWTTFTDPEVASCGYNETMAKKEGIKYDVFTHSFERQDRALAESENFGMIKILTKGWRKKIIGCQIVGPHAGEIIHEMIIALEKGANLATIAGAVHVYPTLAEICKSAAGKYFGQKLFSNRTRKILKFFFRYRGKTIQ